MTTPADRADSVRRAFRSRLPLTAVLATSARSHALYLLDDMTVSELEAVAVEFGLVPTTRRRSKAAWRRDISNAAEHLVRTESHAT